MNKFLKALNVLKPDKPLEWRTFLLISLTIWIASILGTTDEEIRNQLAVLSWLALTIAIGFRTSQPPFIIGGIPLSPWVMALSLCLMIYQKTEATRPYFALKLWPLIAACLVFILEFIRDNFKIQSPPPLVRFGFIIIFLIHINIYCWIEFSIRFQDWLENVPEIIPRQEIFKPDSAKINQEFRSSSFRRIDQG
ncbi:hypothetical protein PCC9214_00243 [Planktothrix tepida]|uniref:Uncharacterized protein n=2 Tax=Planktothrix TaxID=54304 RepID=A0A1J1LG44_9CYAN|nr:MULTISPECIES: DUF5357 family protein [Planktothrix]CAD5914307.1 hypothetical protein PCC9214_00243 [Planktothrix tepida]CAD5986205.1 hypothetical protein NO713_05574 [Planktothrix pseudagardhii]CUR30545.1 conserved membrane hypothetical protein [Planktothrix tepida PCC 9214]